MSTDNNDKNVISKENENENIITSPMPSVPKIDDMNVNVNDNDKKNLNELNDKNIITPSKENNITKSHNDIHRNTIRNYANTNNSYFNNIKNIFTQSDYYPNDTKKSTYYNLSKLNYKDGVILKDAANSNPGYGLWSIKLSDENKFLKKIKEEEDHSIENYNSNIYSNRLFNNVNNIKLKDNSLSDIGIGIDLSLDNSNIYEDEADQIIIKKLTKRSNKLEKRYKKVLNKFYEKDNLYINLEKLKKEYESLVNESIQEKNEMRNRCEKLDNNNQALINSLSNTRKEIERLINVIKEDQIKMREEIQEYNKKLVEEEDKRKKIISRIKFTESQIYILQDKIEQDKNENNFDLNNNNDNNTEGTITSREFNKTNNKITKNKFDNKIDKSKLLLDEQTKKFYKVKKESKKEKDIKINRKKEYIKQLQEELERLKIEDKEKMNERRELFGLIKDKNNNEKSYKNYMDKMLDILDKQEKKNKWNSDNMRIKNNIIYNLKRNSNSK